MTTNVSNQIFCTAAFVVALGYHPDVLAQSRMTAYSAFGTSDIEINGLGFLEVLEPYIKPITQYTVGIHYEKDITRNLSFLTGAQYASRGFGAREELNLNLLGLDIPVGASIETRINYIEAPLLLKYNFTQRGVTPFIKAGASTAYAVNGKITPKVNAIINWNLPSVNINLENDMYNRFDVSALAGAGVRIPTNDFGSLQIEATYRHSLNDMFLDNITNIRIKSHGFSVGIGYSIRF